MSSIEEIENSSESLQKPEIDEDSQKVSEMDSNQLTSANSDKNDEVPQNHDLKSISKTNPKNAKHDHQQNKHQLKYGSKLPEKKSDAMNLERDESQVNVQGSIKHYKAHKQKIMVSKSLEQPEWNHRSEKRVHPPTKNKELPVIKLTKVSEDPQTKPDNQQIPPKTNVRRSSFDSSTQSSQQKISKVPTEPSTRIPNFEKQPIRTQSTTQVSISPRNKLHPTKPLQEKKSKVIERPLPKAPPPAKPVISKQTISEKVPAGDAPKLSPRHKASSTTNIASLPPKNSSANSATTNEGSATKLSPRNKSSSAAHIISSPRGKPTVSAVSTEKTAPSPRAMR